VWKRSEEIWRFYFDEIWFTARFRSLPMLAFACGHIIR